MLVLPFLNAMQGPLGYHAYLWSDHVLDLERVQRCARKPLVVRDVATDSKGITSHIALALTMNGFSGDLSALKTCNGRKVGALIDGQEFK